jgi:glycosyltransferase involved in cell wall biosynthesis
VPRVVFFGSFTPLQGTVTIGEAIASLDRGLLSFTLVGTGQDHAAVREIVGDRDDVTWVDWVAGADLPAFVAAHDICLGIFGDSDKAVSVVPTKVYQGAAAGCALVTSDTDPQRRLFGDAAVLVPPGDAVTLAEVLRALAADRTQLARLQSAAAARGRSFSPNQAVVELTEALAGRGVLAEPGPVPPSMARA